MGTRTLEWPDFLLSTSLGWREAAVESAVPRTLDLVQTTSLTEVVNSGEGERVVAETAGYLRIRGEVESRRTVVGPVELELRPTGT